MTKWFEARLNTDEGRQQIRREVAKRFGWRVDHVQNNSNEIRFFATSPTGTIAVLETSSTTAVSLWTNEEDAWNLVPDYPHDLNVAATLQHPYSTITVQRWNNGHIVVTVNSFEVAELEFIKHVELTRTEAWTEALARCLAWLEVDDIRKNPDPRRMSGQY